MSDRDPWLTEREAAKELRETERVRLDFVCTVTGMKLRHAQQMAKRGEIPSAAQYGRLWTFDRQTVKKWAKLREERSWQTTSTAVARPGGAEFKLPGKSYGEAYERHLRPKRESGSRSGRTS